MIQEALDRSELELLRGLVRKLSWERCVQGCHIDVTAWFWEPEGILTPPEIQYINALIEELERKGA